MATVAMAFLRERALLHRTLSPLCSDQPRLHRTPKIEFRPSDDDHIPEVASLHQIGQYIEVKPIYLVEEFETEVSSNSRVVGSNPFNCTYSRPASRAVWAF